MQQNNNKSLLVLLNVIFFVVKGAKLREMRHGRSKSKLNSNPYAIKKKQKGSLMEGNAFALSSSTNSYSEF